MWLELNLFFSRLEFKLFRFTEFEELLIGFTPILWYNELFDVLKVTLGLLLDLFIIKFC